MFKNVATKVIVTAYDYTTGAYKTGDAANITCYLSKDGAAPASLADTSASELDSTNFKGQYVFDVSATEANADDLVFSGKSATANVQIVPCRYTTLDLSLYGVVARGTAQAGTITTIQLAAATNLIADNNPKGFTIYIASGTGIGQARVINSYANGTDTATVDAWTTNPDNTSVYVVYSTPPLSSTGVTVDAASVRTAVGMAAANLDTQLTTQLADTANIKTRIPTVLISGKMDSVDQFSIPLTESYAAVGVVPTPTQALLNILQMLTAASVSGSVMTVKKRNGSTTAYTLSLNTSYPVQLPTSISQAT
jgi:hypothetical protein